jgi:pantetheine-phosphate adenylyltransferase
MPKIGIYPGTFDPITRGHIDIIERSIKIFDHLVVAIAKDSNKSPVFSIEDRINMVSEEMKGLGQNISVESFNGLLVEFAKEKDASVIVRGLRAVSDFEYEFQLAATNTSLASDIDTILLPATGDRHFISSSMVKEVARLGGDLSNFVSSHVKSKLLDYFNGKKNEGNT